MELLPNIPTLRTPFSAQNRVHNEREAHLCSAALTQVCHVSFECPQIWWLLGGGGGGREEAVNQLGAIITCLLC